jgi:hypothetical protein
LRKNVITEATMAFSQAANLYQMHTLFLGKLDAEASREKKKLQKPLRPFLKRSATIKPTPSSSASLLQTSYT